MVPCEQVNVHKDIVTAIPAFSDVDMALSCSNLEVLLAMCWRSRPICFSLFKSECFHAADGIGCTVLLAACLLPACMFVQIKNQP